jgi:hypothetical protein
MRITTKELRQLLKDLAEEEPDQRAVLLGDRYNHFKDSNPDIIERLLKIAWDHVMTYRPPWDTYGITYGWVKQTIPFMRQGITPREIVREHCGNHQLYEWALPFHPDLLKTDLDKKEDPCDHDQKGLIEALDAFNASYEERISYLGALEELMEYAFSPEVANKEKGDLKENQNEDTGPLKLTCVYSTDAEALYNLMEDDFKDCKQALRSLLQGKPVDGKLNFSGTRIKLVNIFRRGAHNDRFLMSKTDLGKWIAQSFTVENKALVPDTIYSWLTKETGYITKPQNRYRDIPGYEQKEPNLRR